jgi:hypothetical protein
MARKVHKELRQVDVSFLNRAVSGGDKGRATIEEMIDYALNQSWLEEIPTKGTPKYKAGRVTPPAANRN